MIAYLQGQTIAIQEKSIILKTNNIGYLIFVPNTILSEVKLRGELELFIHTHVREDILALYGFKTLDELNFFNLLISVSGIGPKTGLEILSVPSVLIKNAIFTEDLKTLSKIRGLGKKTAQRLVLELKNKIEPLLEVLPSKRTSSLKANEEAIAALSSLGYSRYQIISVLNNTDPSLASPEELIKYFLKNV